MSGGLEALKKYVYQHTATLETSILRMKEISPILEGIWGGAECWGNGAAIDSRWSRVLSSGCREGLEYTRAWDILGAEAREAAQWLGVEVEKVFSVPLVRLGEGSVDGSIRGEIVSSRERTGAQLLNHALSLYQPRKARPAWAWKQQDKISSS